MEKNPGGEPAKPQRTDADGWTREERETLRWAVQCVLPTTAKFWEEVTALVGDGTRLPAECQRKALSVAGRRFSSEEDAYRREQQEAAARLAGGVPGEADLPAGITAEQFGREGGARRVRRFLAASHFGAQDDFLVVGAEAVAREGVEALDALAPAAKAFEGGEEEGWGSLSVDETTCLSPELSPGFFSRLHTGVTPAHTREEGGVGPRRLMSALMEGTPLAEGDDEKLLMPGEQQGPGEDEAFLSGEEEQAGLITRLSSTDLLQRHRHAAPGNLDSFVKDMRERRQRAAASLSVSRGLLGGVGALVAQQPSGGDKTKAGAQGRASARQLMRKQARHAEQKEQNSVVAPLEEGILSDEEREDYFSEEENEEAEEEFKMGVAPAVE